MGVEFYEDQGLDKDYIQRKRKERKKGFLMRFIMGVGLAKNEKQANVVMVIIMILCLTFVIINLWPSGGSAPESNLETISPEES